MELGLSLGESPGKALSLAMDSGGMRSTGALGFPLIGGGRSGMASAGGRASRDGGGSRDTDGGSREGSDSVGRPVQLELLPLRPVARVSTGVLAWQGENDLSVARGFDVNQLPVGEEMEDRGGASSPNSAASSFRMDLSISRRGATGSGGNDNENEQERTNSRASDEEENGSTRKKLRLSKEQSAFLEESFKEHNTLNPKQKLALARQLNLRPRQVEVWFQNRRARTKLKQTEVDCEYLKRCCETLTEENRRLQKELQELRALKTAQPFYMQLPATTLTMCPSCERVATSTAAAPTEPGKKTTVFGQPAAATPMQRNRFFPFSQQHQSAAS